MLSGGELLVVVGDRLFFLLFLLSKRSHILALHRRGVALELLVVLGRGLGLVEDGHVQIVSVLLYLPMLKGVVVRSDLSMHQPASAVVFHNVFGCLDLVRKASSSYPAFLRSIYLQEC